VIDNVAGAGGSGWKPSENNAAWITEVTDTEEFSHGGRGGSSTLLEGAGDGANYGDGGSSVDSNANGYNGHSGIVIIRFPVVTAE
jgi:hypothetical protein